MIKALITAGIFFLIPTFVQAATYKPGSVGYVYEDCKQALERGTRLEDIYQTYCGAYVEGYFGGASVSNWIKLPEPNPQDPCAADKKKEYDRINNRICPNFPDYTQKDVTAGFMVRTTADIVARWIRFLKDSPSKTDPLKMQTSQALNSLIAPGKFCENLKTFDIDENSPITINPALKDIEWKKYLEIQNQVTLERKYKQCKSDLIATAGNKDRFAASWCGAEIAGYIAGLQSTAFLQKARAKPNTACAKEIDRMYRSLDVTQSMCVSPRTDLAQVAEIFIKRYEAGIKAEEGLFNTGNLAAVGYQTIYRGFLCTAGKK